MMDTVVMTKEKLGVIDEKRAAHAQALGVNEARVRTYVLDLQWMLEHGTLVDIDVHGATMFNTRASLTELGIPAGDTRAARLRPGTRELIDEHLTAHHVKAGGATVYLGFDATLPEPQVFFCAKADHLVEAETGLETVDDALVWEAVNLDAQGGRWVRLPRTDTPEGMDEDLPETGWDPVTFEGERARWMRLTFDTDVSANDFLCNPIKAFRSLEVRFRQSLDRYGQSYEGFGGYKWIGFKAYHAWREEWDRLQMEWGTVKGYVLWRYDEFVEALSRDFAEIAAEAWQAMAARHPNGLVCMVGDTPVESLEEFTDVIVERAAERMPSREKIETGLYVDYRPALLLGQETVTADLAGAEAKRTVIEAQKAEQRVIQEGAAARQRLIWDEEQAQQRIIHDQERVERARLENERMKLESMREAELEKARALMANTVSPYQEMFDQLRAEMNAGALQILESLRKNAGLRGKVADKARNMVELFQLMNSHEDHDLDALMVQLEARLPANGGTGKKDSAKNEAIQEALGEIVECTRQEAFEVAHRVGSAYGFEALEM